MARLLRILLVEDHSDDARLFSLALEASRSAGVQWVTDGQEAIDYLNSTGAYGDRSRFPLPDLIVLDLRMHRVNGFEFLAWLMASTFSHIPAFIWTGSLDTQETQRALALGARGVFGKPVRFEEFRSIVGEICVQGKLLQAPGKGRLAVTGAVLGKTVDDPSHSSQTNPPRRKGSLAPSSNCLPSSPSEE